MASLFDKLLLLQSRHTERTPLEDYFTEMFAYLLQDAPEILAAWLVRFKLTQLPGPLLARVATQVSYDRLEGHDRDSRPDLVLQVEAAGRLGLVFVESKIGSKEGDDQLRRYAEHLAAQTDVEERVLVYVTRDYEPKEEINQLDCMLRGRVRFVQLRWYEVYHFLKKNHFSHWLAREVGQFMGKKRMTQELQFSPVDLVAMTNFKRAKTMMDQSLSGDVMNRLQRFGSRDTIKLDQAMRQLEHQERYVLVAYQLEGLWVGLGYFMPKDDSFSYPKIGLKLEVNTHAQGNAAVVLEVMQAILRENPGQWSGPPITQTKQWVGIDRVQPLHNFLQKEDHQQEVKKYFLDCLETLEGIRLRYPQLPWFQAPKGVDSGETAVVEAETLDGPRR